MFQSSNPNTLKHWPMDVLDYVTSLNFDCAFCQSPIGFWAFTGHTIELIHPNFGCHWRQIDGLTGYCKRCAMLNPPEKTETKFRVVSHILQDNDLNIVRGVYHTVLWQPDYKNKKWVTIVDLSQDLYQPS